MPDHDPLAQRLVSAIRSGDTSSLSGLLDAYPGLATTSLQDESGGRRTALHVATDWPGYFPNGPAVVRLLLDAGADPNAPCCDGPPSETPLHWAASSDDVEVAAALIDGGADIEAPGGSLTRGSPLGNAVGYGCWHVARLLVARGARVDTLWQAAALGLSDRMQEFLAASPPPGPDDINEAFWQACHGGQRRAAQLLLAHGADINAAPEYAFPQTPLEIAGALDTRRESVVRWLRELGATSGP